MQPQPPRDEVLAVAQGYKPGLQFPRKEQVDPVKRWHLGYDSQLSSFHTSEPPLRVP